jgi:exonuclease SbcD
LRYPDPAAARDDGDIACCFVADCRGSEPAESERALLGDAFASVRYAEASQ